MRVVALCLLVLGLNLGNAGAAESAPPEWAGLTSEQRAILRNVEKDWASMPGERRGQLIAGANRWLAMTPDQRASARERFAMWQALPPERREELRRRYEQFRALSPEEQARIRAVQQRVQDMPPAKRAELQRRWREMTPQERQRVRPSPARPVRPRGGCQAGGVRPRRGPPPWYATGRTCTIQAAEDQRHKLVINTFRYRQPM